MPDNELGIVPHRAVPILHHHDSAPLSARRADLYPHITDDTHTVRGIVAREKAVEITTVSTA